MKSLKPQEVFEYLKSGFNYLAQDSDGEWCAFGKKPAAGLTYWHNNTENDVRPEQFSALYIEYTGDWKDSLHWRFGSSHSVLPKHLEETLRENILNCRFCLSCSGVFLQAQLSAKGKCKTCDRLSELEKLYSLVS